MSVGDHDTDDDLGRKTGEPAPGADRGLIERVNAAELHAATAKRRSRGRNFLYAVRPEPIPAFRGTIEAPHPGRIGVCCSGGGVRSAAFNLGALQSLQENDVLHRARYLAAVSGGSYIAAAFSMVAKSWPQGEPRPRAEPGPDGKRPTGGPPAGRDDSNPDLIAERAPFAPGSPEEQYLRNRSSYLAPTGMDKLYLVYRIVLGVLFNFTFLALPLFGIGMLLGALLYAPLFTHLAGHCGQRCASDPPISMWLVALAVLAVSAAIGLAALLLRMNHDRQGRFFQIWSTRLLVSSGAIALVTLALPAAVAALTGSGSTGTSAGTSGIVGGGGLASVLAGVAAHLREAVKSPSKGLDELSRAQQWLAKLNSLTRRIIAYTVAAIVGPALLLAVMVFAASLTLAHSKPGLINGWHVVIGLGALAAFAGIYDRVDLTSWSLHPFYKRRLCTAFALKRVKPSDLDPDEDGHAERCIAQNEQYGIAIERDFDTLVPLSETALRDGSWPTLLVCAAANISDPGATPPGRSVTSFTFSPHAIGGPLVGGVRTEDFEDAVGRGSERRSRDCSLPAAVAMSGAALSPSMGKMTRRPLTFLLALANVRLGVWVPNPRWVAATANAFGGRSELSPKAAELCWRRLRRARPSYLVRELIGRNRIDAKYLYVTDGGHYENLGLVELLRRGCTRIYCFDASGGQDFQELGDAVALARSELGVEISIDPTPLVPASPDNIAAANVVRGSFTYMDEADGTPVEGTLVYARNVMTADAPWDVKAHHERDPGFPHDATADQLYTDQKFESYRALGFCAGGHAVNLMRTRARPGVPSENGHRRPAAGSRRPSSALTR
jgi:hypothetical protein